MGFGRVWYRAKDWWAANQDFARQSNPFWEVLWSALRGKYILEKRTQRNIGHCIFEMSSLSTTPKKTEILKGTTSGPWVWCCSSGVRNWTKKYWKHIHRVTPEILCSCLANFAGHKVPSHVVPLNLLELLDLSMRIPASGLQDTRLKTLQFWTIKKGCLERHRNIYTTNWDPKDIHHHRVWA